MSDDHTTDWIIGGTVGGVAVLCILVVIITVFVRRHQRLQRILQRREEATGLLKQQVPEKTSSSLLLPVKEGTKAVTVGSYFDGWSVY